jgi:UDP-N-acetylmuramate dehydrogenase
MIVTENRSLKEFNTFGVDVISRYFAVAENIAELRTILQSEIALNNKIMILGGGSNVLFTSDFDGLVVHPGIKFIKEKEVTENEVVIEAGAGVVWDNFVEYCLKKKYWGVENLISIPGTVGAAPIQNIGAYGVEQETVFEHCNAISLKAPHEERIYSPKDCKFSYRNSIFKEHKNEVVITSVTYRLLKHPKRNLSYRVLKEYFEQQGNDSPTLKEISEAVAGIRASKLPDPEKTGNGGSFFKNPVITKEEFRKLIEQYPEMPYYQDNELYKIPAAWLIEKSGWKGRRIGDAGVHDKQALVIVNYGSAGGNEIRKLSEMVRKSVFQKFNILLTPEVNII